MRAVGWAFAWEMWGRNRIVTVLALAYLLVLILLVNALLAGTLDPEVVAQLTLPLGCAVHILVGVFSHAEHADLGARESAYPARSFALPLPTVALAVWPMALGATAGALLWLAVAGLVLRPGGLPVPLLWPAVFMASLLCWVQAVMWFPFPLPFLRLIVALPILGGMIVGMVLACAAGASPTLLLAVFAGLIPAGFLVAVVGVERARRGDTPVWTWPILQRRVVGATAPSFASPAAAMFWLEWRRNGFLLPLMVALVLVPLMGVLVLTGGNEHPSSPPFLRAAVFLGSIILFLPSMAFAAGACLGNGHPWSRKVSALPAFCAARPVTSAEMIAVKLRVTIRATLLTTALAVLLIVGFLPFSSVGAVLGQWVRQLLESQGAKGGVLLGLAVLGLVVLSGKEVVNQLWIGLTGRTWVGGAVIFTLVAGMMVVAFGFRWAAMHPGSHQALLAAIPWVVGLLLLLKLGAGVMVARALRRRGLVADRTLMRFAVGWVAAAVVLFGVAFWLMPPDVGSPLAAGCAAVLLILPLVRLGLAPLALDWNRHR